jgi:hypothetical protein
MSRIRDTLADEILRVIRDVKQITYEQAYSVTGIPASKLNLIVNKKLEVRVDQLVKMLPSLSKLDEDAFSAEKWLPIVVEAVAGELGVDSGMVNFHIPKYEMAPSGLFEEGGVDPTVLANLATVASATIAAAASARFIGVNKGVIIDARRGPTFVVPVGSTVIRDVFLPAAEREIMHAVRSREGARIPAELVDPSAAANALAALSEGKSVLVPLGSKLIGFTEGVLGEEDAVIKISSLPETHKYARNVLGNPGNFVDGFRVYTVGVLNQDVDLLTEAPIDLVPADRRSKKQISSDSIESAIGKVFQVLIDPVSRSTPVSLDLKSSGVRLIAMLAVYEDPRRHGTVDVMVYSVSDTLGADQLTLAVQNVKRFHRAFSLYMAKDRGLEYVVPEDEAG